jgi:hypothetical protein
MNSVAEHSFELSPRALATRYDESLAARVLAGLLCLVLFLTLNPFVALLLLAVVSLNVRVPAAVFIVIASVTFAVFFYNREYGIEFYPGLAGDDIPHYRSLYESNYGYTLSGLWQRFVESPNGYEILWHAPWWFAVNELEMDTETFVFLHYLVNFATLFITLRLLSTRYWLAFGVVYFFLTPLAVDVMTNIFRQQLAFAMFVSGIALRYRHNSRAGSWLMYASPFMHFSVVFYLITYWTFLALRRMKAFDHKLRFVVLLTMLMAIVPALSSMAVAFLDSLGIAKIMSFFETGGGSELRIYLVLLGYAVPMLAAFFWLDNDDINRLFLLLNFAVFSIVLALPGANGIYDRLLMFTLPLMGLYFFRLFLRNFSPLWRAPALVAIFALGTYRMYLPTLEQNGVMYFLAYGHGFDPFMGLIRMLVVF